jgi:hypothetical protein
MWPTVVRVINYLKKTATRNYLPTDLQALKTRNATIAAATAATRRVKA